MRRSDKNRIFLRQQRVACDRLAYPYTHSAHGGRSEHNLTKSGKKSQKKKTFSLFMFIFLSVLPGRRLFKRANNIRTWGDQCSSWLPWTREDARSPPRLLVRILWPKRLNYWQENIAKETNLLLHLWCPCFCSSGPSPRTKKIFIHIFVKFSSNHLLVE